MKNDMMPYLPSIILPNKLDMLTCIKQRLNHTIYKHNTHKKIVQIDIFSISCIMKSNNSRYVDTYQQTLGH